MSIELTCIGKCGTSRSEVTVNYALNLKLRIMSFIIPFNVNSAASFECPISSTDIQVSFACMSDIMTERQLTGSVSELDLADCARSCGARARRERDGELGFPCIYCLACMLWIFASARQDSRSA